MKVMMRTAMSGPDGSVAAGRIADVTREQGHDLIAGGFAVAVGSEDARPTSAKRRKKARASLYVETATAPAPENAATRTGRE